MRRLSLVLASILLASPAAAQELAIADPRIVSMPVGQGRLLPLQTSPDVSQTLLFDQGERITSVVLSDPTMFFVNVAGTGDSLSLRAGSQSAFAVMTVRTNLRTYEFELLTASAAPAVIRLVRAAPDQPAPPVPVGTQERVAYRLSGNRSLRPTSISDDGQKTYIEWAGDRAMPATFALGPTGEEQMVDGYMRAGKFTIDRIYETLIFRIDKERAKARRQERKDGDG